MLPSRPVLRDRIDAGRAAVRAADRRGRRPAHVRALYRLAHRPPGRFRGGDHAVLAGLEVDHRRRRHLPGRPIRRRQHHRAEAGGRACGIASGLDHLRDVRLRLSVRLCRPAAGGAAGGGDRGAVPFRAAPLPRQPDLYGRATELTIMSAGPRQLALALDHSESLAREDFLGGPSNAAALALVDAWPDWTHRAVVLIGPEGSGKSHLAAIWAQAAGGRCSISSISPARTRPLFCSRRAPRPPDGRWPCVTSARGSRRSRWSP